METRVTSPTWGPPPPCKQALNPLIEVFGSTETFACLRCEKGFKNEKSNQSLFLLWCEQGLTPQRNAIEEWQVQLGRYPIYM